MPENVTGFQPTGNLKKSLIDLAYFDMFPRRSLTFFREEPEIVVVDHRGGFHDPRIGSAGVAAAATLRAHDPRLFLGLADIEHALASGEPSQVFLRDVVL